MNEKTLKELFESENLSVSDGFVSNLVGLFESAVEKEKEKMENDSKEKLEEKIKELDENVDAFISSKTKQWINENAVKIEDATKVRLAESLFTGLKKLAEENNIELDDSHTMIVEQKDAEIAELKEDNNKRIEKELQLESKLNDIIAKSVIVESTKDLAMTQIENVEERAKDLVFESEETYKEKIDLIVESIVNPTAKIQDEDIQEPTIITEDVDPEVQAVLNLMK